MQTLFLKSSHKQILKQQIKHKKVIFKNSKIIIINFILFIIFYIEIEKIESEELFNFHVAIRIKPLLLTTPLNGISKSIVSVSDNNKLVFILLLIFFFFSCK